MTTIVEKSAVVSGDFNYLAWKFKVTDKVVLSQKQTSFLLANDGNENSKHVV